MQREEALLRVLRGLRRFLITTTSEKATVIPPPVKGCRILNASPIRSAPGVGRGAPGMLLFGIVFMFPFSIDAKKAV